MHTLLDFIDPNNSDHSEGKRLKQKVHNHLEVRRRAVVRRARRAMILLGFDYLRVRIDQVREAVPCPPEVNPVVFGCVPVELAKLGIFRRIGFEPTDRPEAHDRPVSIWELANIQAAERWLAANPELSDSADAEEVARG